jgi:hypothetical protein
MSIIPILLVLAITLGLVIFLLTYTLNRIAGLITGHFNAQFRAAEEIINQDRVPLDWIKKYQDKIDQLERKGGTGTEIDRFGRRAKKDLIKRVKALRKFLDTGKYYDSLMTKERVLEELHEREERWSASPWQDLLATPLAASATEEKERGGATDSG